MRIVHVILLLLVAAIAPPAYAQPAAELLKMERVFTIDLRVTEQQWQMMQPTRASRLATILEVRQHPASGRGAGPYVEGQRIVPSGHGYEYGYVRAAVEIDGQRTSDVGLRFRGNGSYGVTMGSLKRPMQLDFGRFIEGQTYHGMERLYLRNNALDPSELREALSFAICREFGVPAPLTSLASVYLTIDGKYDREFLGIYTISQEIDKEFLQQNFGSHKGLLIKPETTRSWAYLGDNWDVYARFGVKTPGNRLTHDRFMELTRVVNFADDREFAQGLGRLLDLDEFLRFLAVNVAMVNTDSFIGLGHNFYVYVHPKTGKISFIPWDMNYSFGSWGGSMNEWTGLNIRRPQTKSNLFLERVLADSTMRQVYYAHLRKLCDGPFSPARMHERITRMEQVVQRAMEASKAKGRPTPTTMPVHALSRRPDLKEFVTIRVKVVRDQLEAEAKVAAAVAVPPSVPVAVVVGPAPVVRPAPVAAPVAAPSGKAPIAPVRTAGVVKRAVGPNPLVPRLMAAIDPMRDGQLSRQEALDAAGHMMIAHARWNKGPADASSIARTLDQIGSLLDVVPPSVAEHATTAPGGTAIAWGKAIVASADAKGDGQVTVDELLAMVDQMLREFDANGDGMLNQKELGTALDRMVPRQ